MLGATWKQVATCTLLTLATGPSSRRRGQPRRCLGLASPKALQPAAPEGASSGQVELPDFWQYAATLEEVQNARAQLQEVVSAGRRLGYIATARLQRGDLEGAQSALEQIDAMPSLASAVGDLWSSPERRLRLCESCNVSGFLEVYVATCAFQRFLQTGQLLPTVPTAWRTEIVEYDNECYLMGLIAALREMERYGVNRGQALDLPSVEICLRLAQGLEEVLMQFSFRNSALRQRFDGVKYSVKRLESLSYEITMARQRAGGFTTSQPSSTEDAALDMEVLNDSKRLYEEFDENREQVMKRSRDVVKAAKNAIYALQREDWKRADSQIQLCADQANAIYADVACNSPTLRLGFFSGALEEMAEALAYRAFRADGKLLNLDEMQGASGLQFPLLLMEYLGGIMDLTGEVGRLAIRSGQRRDAEAIKSCLTCVEAVYDGVSILPYLPGSLSKKIGPLKGTLNKIEQVLYELALLSPGSALADRKSVV